MHCQIDGPQPIVSEIKNAEENKSHPTVTVSVLIWLNFAWREATHSQSEGLQADNVPGGH